MLWLSHTIHTSFKKDDIKYLADFNKLRVVNYAWKVFREKA